MESIVGKVGIVTGASSGIGKGIAYALSQHGVKLVINGRNIERLNAVAADIRKSGGEVEVYAGDITEESTHEKLVELAVERYGALHIAVNVPAIQHMRKVYEYSGEEIDGMINVNIKGMIYAIKHQIKGMQAYSRDVDHQGCIINIGSTFSNIVSKNSSIGCSIFSAGKAFLDLYTKIAALEANTSGYHIRINSVNPGVTHSEGLLAMVKSSDVVDQFAKAHTFAPRAAQPSTIAAFVVHVIQNSFINGTNLVIDGGMQIAV
jgi:NAD(P)-dependent dehydrogenase (short-subunit alcohol dehydrogenase family)